MPKIDRSYRIDKELIEELDKEAVASKIPRTTILEDALRNHLKKLKQNRYMKKAKK